LAVRTSSYELGAPISFDAKVDASGVREIGQWWEPEPWGTWTGKEAGLVINLAQDVKTNIVLEAVAGAFVNEKNPQINVQVHVNDIAAGSWSFSYKKDAPPYRTYAVTIPKAALGNGMPLTISFQVSGARSPSEIGIGGDPRTLGLAIVHMRLVAQPQ
jgi:hypothetical protein